MRILYLAFVFVSVFWVVGALGLAAMMVGTGGSYHAVRAGEFWLTLLSPALPIIAATILDRLMRRQRG